MVSLEDNRWTELKGGYRLPFDPRPALSNIAAGKDLEDSWHELWEELHHQGDVGEASYAAVPVLVGIHLQRDLPDWNAYALVARIELARGEKQNPKVPDWLEPDYSSAIQELAEKGIAQLKQAKDFEEVRAILSVIALTKGLRTYARLILNYSEEELLEFESSYGM